MKMNQITVTSNNILANSYVKPEWFTRTESKYLDWNFRKQLLADKLKELQSDIICLQEVEQDAFDFLVKVLASYKYIGIYKSKINKPDGCACFYRSDKLNLEGVTVHYYNDKTNGETNSGHLAIITKFKFDIGIVGVINTHLKWDKNKENNHIGLIQIRELVESFVNVDTNVYGWIICGDLNSVPSSAVVKELTNNNFIDIYASKEQNTSNSNFKAKRVDYIFCSKEINGTPKEIREIDDMSPLPAESEPSDHLAITATLLF
jgi:mRNA deadenylase 3'-5' endonuclease subunit Ccr4